MTAALAHEPPFTPEEYLRFEADSEVKHEYARGDLYAMAGATEEHELVAGNVFVSLHRHLRGKGCRVFKSDMKLRLALHRLDIFYYPDVMVVCDPQDSDPLFKSLPKVLVEVMSDFKKDHLEKLFAYQQISSLEEYLIVDQDTERPRAWVYRRETGWEQEEITSGENIVLPSLEFTLPLAACYET